MTNDPTAATVRAMFDYDPSNGYLVDQRTRQRRGWISRSRHKSRVVSVHGKHHHEHRIVWLYVHGAWPAGLVDHIDRDPQNNRITNLRVVTHSTNQHNRVKPARTNTSGYIGVSWDKRTRKWHAKIGVRGQRLFLGAYSTRHQAAVAYQQAKLIHHPSASTKDLLP